jgi:hypothetical protein
MKTSKVAVGLFLAFVCAGVGYFAIGKEAVSVPIKEENKISADVQVYTYSSGLTAFLDKKLGKIYLYDGNLKNCIMIVEIDQLGLPFNPKQVDPPKS